MGYKTKLVEWFDDDAAISVECLYESDDPGHDDEWIPDMATLVVNSDPYHAPSDAERRYIWGKAYDLANG